MLIVNLLVMTLIGAIGALLLKLVSAQESYIKKLSVFVAGSLFYLISSIINIIVLKSYDYSIVYPATAIAYIWTMLLGKFILNEPITKNKVMGCSVIILGIILLTY